MTKPLRIGIVTSANRRCGIWTYSENERDGLLEHPDSIREVGFVAIDDRPREHNPSTLITTIEQGNLDSWRQADEQIAAWEPDLMLFNHEHGLGGPSYKAWSILAERLHHRGIPFVVTPHTTKYHPSKKEILDLGGVFQYAAGITALNRIANKEIIQAGLYGDIDPCKAHYFVHPVRETDVSLERKKHLKSRDGLEGRMVSVSVGLNADNKGTDKLMRALGEMWSNGDLTVSQKEAFIHLQMGDYHEGFKDYQEGKPCLKFDQGLKRTADAFGLPWIEFPGVKEFREADLTPYAFVFVKHFLNDDEYKDALVIGDIRFMGNQEPEQAATGVGIGTSTAGTLIATDSLATRSELFLPTKRTIHPISAQEMDSGYIVAQSWAGVREIREAYVRLIQDEGLRNEMDSIGRSKRPTKTWKHVMGKQIEYFQTIL